MSPSDLGIKRKILELWLRGIDYREIHARTSTSLGAISDVINSYKAEHSDLEQLRALGSKLPSGLDFAQVSTLLQSIISLQKQFGCNIEEVPALVEGKVSIANEIERLNHNRDSISTELSELQKFKQEEQNEINSLRLRHDNLLRETKILEFRRADRQRDLIILAQAIARGQKMVNP